ncbi:hypothetical protein CKAN_02634800 [Cinnamomum micranthum f. kanehirae]|uniref:Uncharacterized protein n=1 Tax=Cinnamomum micranthum f. kanehirae TaxID=337451 RepID=A0A443Q1P5_9MAGN|nr:hypothetical protein CKAN_02634800 [Cinnamomum micranthum f. kanehirae]
MNSPPLQPPAGTPRCRRSRPITQNLPANVGHLRVRNATRTTFVKSREKSKGTHNLKSCDVALDHRLITRQGVDKRIGLINVGGSAMGILDHLTDRNWEEVDGEMEDDGDVKNITVFVKTITSI